MTANRFRYFIAIDWSGAAGECHKGIAVGLCKADGGAPFLVRPDHIWSRQDVLDYLINDLPPECLIGMDLGIALPLVDCGAYFPGWSRSPRNAAALWAMVDRICAGDPHLGASSFVDHPVASRYFRRHGGREGDLFQAAGALHRRGRMRVTENRQAMLGCTPYSNFNLVGAAQVGKSSLTGMRVLHHLRGIVPTWPIDPLLASGSVLVEIYTTIAAMAGGRTAGRSKMSSAEELNAALHHLGCPPLTTEGPLDDHRCDALLSAAWLRIAANRAELWSPPSMTHEIAQTEGWTFGAV